MGKGAGVKIDLDFILRIIELVILTLALVFFFMRGNQVDLLVSDHKSSLSEATDALTISSSAFILILGISLGMQFIKNKELDKQFEAWIFTVGAILLITCGIALAIYAGDYRYSTRFLISGLIGVIGGCALLVSALKYFKVF